MPITKSDLENWFTHHPPQEEDLTGYTAIRTAGRYFASVILDNTPACADQTAAIRKVREAVFTSNAAIACGGK